MKNNQEKAIQLEPQHSNACRAYVFFVRNSRMKISLYTEFGILSVASVIHAVTSQQLPDGRKLLQSKLQYEGTTIPSTHGDSASNSSPSNDTECPTWFLFNNRSRRCECGSELDGILHCDEMKRLVYIIDCYCMTNGDKTGLVVGSCSTNCIVRSSNSSLGSFTLLPSNISQLNDAMCGERWNRNGRLCGKCKSGYYRSTYSYRFDCVKCSDSNQARNWVQYITFAFLSVTIFYMLAFWLRINSSNLFPEGMVTYFQIIASPPSVHLGLAALTSQPKLAIFIKIIFTISGFFNLDFFRTVLPPTCLNVNTLQALVLDYAIALYPVVLVMITCILIKLHDNDCTMIVWLFRPFRECPNLHTKSSIINVFSAIFCLSYAKLLIVSADLLAPVLTYDTTGEPVGIYLYSDANIEYFGTEHLPYALLAVFVVVTFIILPIILLIIYPMRCCSFLRKWSPLQVYLDTYQGYYKDGTNGTIDCRWFSCVYLLVRLLLLSIFNFVINSYFYALAALVFLLMTLLHVVVKPYREHFQKYNTIHAILSLSMSMLFITLLCIDASSFQSVHTNTFSVILCCLILAFYSIFGISNLFYHIYLLYLLKCCDVKHFCLLR